VKIAFINDAIYNYACGEVSAVGGAEWQQWLVARALATRGWSVSVGITEGLALGETRFVNGVKFVGIGGPRMHILLAWSRFLSAERPDWLYWRCASHLLGLAFALAKLLGVRTIFSAALDSDVDARHALAYRSQWWRLYAWGLAWADRIFVQHGTQFARLKPKLQSKAYLVSNIAEGTEIPKPHDERGKDIVWVGQLRYAKRPDLLIEIARKRPELHFIVCGGASDFGSPPGYSERIIEMLRKLRNIDYRGQVAPHAAVKIIADAALLLSTSDEEGFPNTFLHAWANGTPVISLKIDPDDVIKRKGLGVVSGDLEKAAVDIGALVKSAQRRDEIASRAFRYVARYHSEAAVTESFARAILRTRPSTVIASSASQMYSNS
jgi:glycosyltransferase involved in cell wall biosynthesis